MLVISDVPGAKDVTNQIYDVISEVGDKDPGDSKVFSVGSLA
jgi:hypothetical protein